jgi:sn-glycerol 3-phosphate transport system permease protein
VSAPAPAVVPDGSTPDSSTPDAAPPRARPFSRANLLQTVVGGYVPLAVAVLVVFLPLLWMVLNSFKQPGEIVTLDLQVLPAALDPENYRVAMTTVPFGQFFLNSTIVTVVGSGIKVILALLTAYALVFVRFPFKNLIFILILVALMVPAQVSILPNYILIAGMGG